LYIVMMSNTLVLLGTSPALAGLTCHAAGVLLTWLLVSPDIAASGNLSSGAVQEVLPSPRTIKGRIAALMDYVRDTTESLVPLLVGGGRGCQQQQAAGACGCALHCRIVVAPAAGKDLQVMTP
jgi:hypothetical protein